MKAREERGVGPGGDEGAAGSHQRVAESTCQFGGQDRGEVSRVPRSQLEAKLAASSFRSITKLPIDAALPAPPPPPHPAPTAEGEGRSQARPPRRVPGAARQGPAGGCRRGRPGAGSRFPARRAACARSRHLAGGFRDRSSPCLGAPPAPRSPGAVGSSGSPRGSGRSPCPPPAPRGSARRLGPGCREKAGRPEAPACPLPFPTFPGPPAVGGRRVRAAAADARGGRRPALQQVLTLAGALRPGQECNRAAPGFLSTGRPHPQIKSKVGGEGCCESKTKWESTSFLHPSLFPRSLWP